MKVLVFKDIKNNRYTLWNESKTKHLGYRKTLTLKNANFVVIESKRKQVLKTKKRFPHAWIIGEITLNKKLHNQVKYNPFLNKKFMAKNKPVIKASKVFLNSKGQVFI